MATPMTVSQIVSQCKKWKIPYEVYSDAVGRPGSFTPIGFIIHHTGGPYTESDSYLRFLFEIGRPSEGIPGQLCQFSGGPSGKIYIGKMARANHAGRGDFTTRQLVGAENYPGYSSEINPGSDDYGTGNALYYGLEINYPGTLKMRSAQYNSAVRLAAAIMDFHGWEALSSIGHREHSSRKWDPGQCALDKFRRDVRDLLRAGPEGDTVAINKNDVETIAKTDGIFDAPPDSPGAKSGSNKFWHLNSHIRNISNHILYRKDLWWKVRLPWFGTWTDHEGTEERWPNGYTAQANLGHAHRYGHENNKILTDVVVPHLQQIKAAQGGTERDEVLSEIQSELQTTKNLLSTVADRLDDVIDLVEEFADGTLNAEQVAEQLMAKFHTATAPDEQEEEV